MLLIERKRMDYDTFGVTGVGGVWNCREGGYGHASVGVL